MGYHIKKLPYTSRQWKVQYRIYGKDVKSYDLTEQECLRLGLHHQLTYEQAVARKNQLNAQEKLKRDEEKRLVIRKRIQKEDSALDAYLHKEDVQEFETGVLYSRLEAKPGTIKRNKIESHWRATKRILCALKIDPIDWVECRTKFYDYFATKKMSPAYLQKVIRILNLWGKFHSRKYRRFFEPLPYPTGYEKERVSDSYFDKNEGGFESDPLSPGQLESKKVSLKPEHYNWLYLSIWFGLRPSEVDMLLKPESKTTWRIETLPGGKVLWVYQSKLTSIPRDKRLKPIPCHRPEQLTGLDIISTQNFKRPLTKTTRSYFGERVTCYGGRKGFTDLMLGYGYKFEDISIWMGHRSIERTWKSYKDKQRVWF
jgi:hypothetical protein